MNTTTAISCYDCNFPAAPLGALFIVAMIAFMIWDQLQQNNKIVKGGRK